MRILSILLGIVLAILVPATCVVVFVLLSASIGDGVAETMGGALVILVLSVAVIVTPVLFLGLPYVLLLQWRRALTWLNVCLGSTILGALSMAFFKWFMGMNTHAPYTWSFVIGAGLGLASGVGFCLGARPAGFLKLRAAS